jgi:hypothetical protein
LGNHNDFYGCHHRRDYGRDHGRDYGRDHRRDLGADDFACGGGIQGAYRQVPR